jgi:hypothetical protein
MKMFDPRHTECISTRATRDSNARDFGQRGISWLFCILLAIASATGMGLAGLSWQEIEAWARCNDFIGILSPKEYNAIYSLSRTYVAEYAEASKKGAKPPYVKVEEYQEKDEVAREMIAEKADDVFAAMIFAQERK